MSTHDATAPAPLIIRAPSGKTDDLQVDAQVGWSIQQLKAHITTIHPAHPISHEQKLVYAGRLLQDHLTLDNVLRHFEPGVSQTIHLVVTEQALQRSISTPAPYTATTVGLRQRNIAPTPPAAAAVTPSHLATPATPATPTTPAMPLPQSAGFPSSLSPQQQQAYYYYYGYGASPNTSPQAAYYAHMMQAYARTYGMPASPAAAASPYANTGAAGSTAAAAAAAGAAAAAAGAAAAAAAGPDLQGQGHRFAQAGVGAAPIVANEPDAAAAGAGQPRAAGGERGAHWIISNLMLIGKLVLLVWLFGHDASPLRFGLLCGFAFMIFLYQGGWLKLRPVWGRAAPGEDVAAGAAAVAAAAGGAAEQHNNNVNDDDSDSTEVAEEEEEDPDLQPPPSVVYMLTTVVTRFFTSLVPERQVA